MRMVTPAGAAPCPLLLIELYGQTVGVAEEEERLVGVLVGTDGLVGDMAGVQLCCRRGYVVDLEGEVAQPRSLGIGEARGWSGEGEELYDIGVAEVAVGLPRVALAAILFATDFEPEHFGVEALGPTVVATDYGYMVYMVEFHLL